MMIDILASGGLVIPMNWKRGSAFENNDSQVSGSRSLALLKAFIEISISLQFCQQARTIGTSWDLTIGWKPPLPIGLN